MHRSTLAASITAAVILLLVAWAPVRAQDATPRATSGGAEPTTEVLLDATMDALPTGRSRVAVDRWRLRPSPRVLRVPALGGPVIVVVESGAIAATVAGTEYQLAAGDQLALSGDQESAFSSAGPEEAVAFVVYVVPSFATAGADWDTDPLAHAFDYPIDASHDALPGGSGRLLLERLTLPPGATLPAQEASALIWYGAGEGRVGIALEGDRLPFRWDPGEEREFAAGQSLPFIAPGTRMTLRNADDGPVVLYRLTLTPAGAGVAAATPLGGTPAP